LEIGREYGNLKEKEPVKNRALGERVRLGFVSQSIELEN
jgi:hypothetical protein